MVVHGHGGNTLVTATKGAGNVCAQCQYASIGQLDNGRCPHPRVLELAQGHMLVVIPRPGVHMCIDLHLHTKEGHQVGVQPGVARQRTSGLAAHIELRHLACGLHGVLYGSSDLDRKTLVVHGVRRGGLGHPAPDYRLRGVRWHTAEDAVLMSGPPPRCARNRGVTMALWQASPAVRPGIPLRLGALSFRARSRRPP